MIQLPESGFLRLPQILGDSKHGIPPLIPVSRTTWWAGVRDGRFPKAVRLGKNCTMWRAEDIRTLIANAEPAWPAVRVQKREGRPA
jgi:predicted DNA-binding transcriptional regulator AlpA